MILERKSCVICDKSLSLKKIIKDVPLHMGVKTDAYMEDIFLDQLWGECSNCGCVQLMNLVHPNVLYSVGYDSGSQGELWRQHHEEFAKFILSGNPDAIFEIGGLNGTLANIIFNHVYDINYSIVDPIASISDKRIKLYNMLFENYENNIYGSVVHSHTIEHVLNPKEFLQKIFNLMPDNGSMYMSFPNTKETLISNSLNALCFEHTYYLDINQFKYLLQKIGFEIKEQYDFQSHSYFLKVIKNKNLIKKNKHLEKNFEQIIIFNKIWKQTELFAKTTLSKLNSVPTYLFGANIFSQSLILLGLKHESINGVLDDSPFKQGKKLYGYNLEVYASENIAGLKNVNVVLRAGKYQNQIKNRLLKINPNVTIFE